MSDEKGKREKLSVEERVLMFHEFLEKQGYCPTIEIRNLVTFRTE